MQRAVDRARLDQLEEVLAALHTFDCHGKRDSEMIAARAAGILCGVAAASLLGAGDLSSYRELQFGMSLAAAAKQLGSTPADARLVHQRPALIQEIDWQPPSTIVAALAKADPVREATLCFFNGQLYRIVVTYDRYRIEGMTAEDLVDAISATYGPATKPAAEIGFHSIYGETAPVLARWQDAEYSYNLVRIGDQSGFALILYSKRLELLAQAAITEAVRLDALEAPQREIAQQKKHDQDEGLVLEKARSLNKPNFRP